MKGVPLAVWLAVAGWLAVLAFWATMTPAYRAPDEPQHVSAILGLAAGEGWPPPAEAEIDPAVLRSAVLAGFLTTPDQPTSRGNTLPGVHVATGREQPPLFSATAPTPVRDRLPYAELSAPEATGFTNQMTQHPPAYYGVEAGLLLVTGAQDWRFDRQLALLRLGSVVMVGVLPLLGYLTVRRLSGSTVLGVAAAYLPFAVPQLAHVGSSVTNDALLVTAGAVVTAGLAHVVTGSRSIVPLLVVGDALGVALLTKGLALPLVPAVALVLLIGPRRTGYGWAATLGRALLPLGVAFAIGGWWWLVNLVRYGTLQPNGFGVDRPSTAEPVGPVSYATRFTTDLATSFWGNFGWLELPMAGVATTALAVATAALASAAFAVHRSRVPLLLLGLLPLAVLAALFVTLYGVHLRDGRFNGIQGRYLYGGLVSLLAAVAVGLGVLGRLVRLPDRWLVPLVGSAAALVAAYGTYDAFAGFWRDVGVSLADGWDRMVAFSPWPAWLVTAQLVAAVALLVAGVVVSGLHRAAVCDADRPVQPSGGSA